MSTIPITEKEPLLSIGWNEWCALPHLNIPAIKAKIDTGAKTSALHAFNIHTFYNQGQAYVQFDIHPLQRNQKKSITCCAPVADQRYIMSSNGHKEHRLVIETTLALSNKQWPIELTLSNRDPLKFRMLLGRQALENQVIIDPAHSLKLGRLNLSTLKSLYP